MKINLQKQQDIINEIKEFVTHELFTELHFLTNNTSVLIGGSIASNTYDKNSDIDLHIITTENIAKKYKNELRSYKRSLISSGSNIELRFARTIDVLEKHLSFNDDFILGELSEGIIIFDASNRLSNLLENFKWYPNDIFKDKITWLLSESLIILKKELPRAISRSNNYYVKFLFLRLSRYFLTLIRLINHKYPTYDKKLLETVSRLQNKPRDFNKKLSKLLALNVLKESMSIANDLYGSVARLSLTGNPQIDIEKDYLLNFSTKNKITFE